MGSGSAVELDEVAAIECEHGSTQAGREGQNLIICDPANALTGALSGQYVMREPAQFVDDRM
jgi:hypothetical protein